MKEITYYLYHFSESKATNELIFHQIMDEYLPNTPTIENPLPTSPPPAPNPYNKDFSWESMLWLIDGPTGDPEGTIDATDPEVIRHFKALNAGDPRNSKDVEIDGKATTSTTTTTIIPSTPQSRFSGKHQENDPTNVWNDVDDNDALMV
jgi:hypothetical protein